MNESTLVICLVNVLTILIGVFVASIVAYGKRKGEINAENENFRTLLGQVKETTEAQKRIEASITEDVWNRQKQWEMRRDTVFEVVKALGELEDALKSLYSVHSISVPETKEEREHADTQLQNELANFNTCNNKLFRTMFVTRLVVGKELHKRLTECSNEIRSISRKIIKETKPFSMRSESEADTRNLAEFDSEALMDKTMAVILSARKALKIEITE